MARKECVEVDLGRLVWKERQCAEREIAFGIAGIDAIDEVRVYGENRGIDGMRLDTEGNLIATAGWEIGGPGPLIYVFAPSGEVVNTHSVPCTRPTNCAFGGDDLTTLYVTTIEGFLFRAQTEHTGRPLYRGPAKK